MKQALMDRIARLSTGIAAFLAAQQTPEGGFPAREFYGKAFAALLWLYTGSARCAEKALQAVAVELSRPLPKNYHYEFNRFALLHILERRPDLGPMQRFFPKERYTGTRVANWTLLRACCRLKSGKRMGAVLGRVEILAVRLWFSYRSGVIDDKRGAYTMQYHAFSVALLGELLLGPLRGSRILETWFRRSAAALASLVMPDGQCNYLGRGSLQSFGYAAALLAFAHACRLTGEHRYWEGLERVLSYLESFQRRDGSLPLMLRSPEEGAAAGFDLQDAAYAGWYSYNNFYDYLPFTGALLCRATEVLEGAQDAVKGASRQNPPVVRELNGELRQVRTAHYTAVLSLPNRVLASSMPMPFLGLRQGCPLPSYGGEQKLPSIYSVEGLPLPIVMLEDGTAIAMARGRYRWSGMSFEGRLFGVCHSRQFEFHDLQITVRDEVSWSRTLKVRSIRLPRLLLPQGWLQQGENRLLGPCGAEIAFETPVEKEPGVFYGPHGCLTAYSLAGHAHSVSSPSVSVLRISLKDAEGLQ